MPPLSRRQFWAGATAAAVAPTLAPAFTGAAAVPAAAASPVPGFARPPAGARPKIRYWWPCGEITAETVDAELKAIADRGFGAVEIQCFFTSDPKRYGWGSPVLTERLEQAVAAGRAYGVRVDLTVGPAWPLLTPGLTPDSPESAQELVYGRTVLAGGESYDGPVPAGPAPAAGVTRQTLVAVQAFRCAGPADAKPTVLEKDTLVDLTGAVRDGSVSFTAPADGTWLLLGFWQRGTGQIPVVRQSVSAEPAYIVDHFSAAGTRSATDYTDAHVLTPRLRSLLRANGGDVFEDSLELDSAQHWTWGLLTRFEQLCGYSLRPLLPVVFIDRIHRQYTPVGPDDAPDFEFTDGIGARVREDYYRTLTDLYLSEHVEPLKQWAHGLGLRLRAQPYGTTTDVATVGAALDVNETESLGLAPGYADEPFRWISAGSVHLSGQRVYSLEGCATLDEAYAQTWPQMLAHFNTAFAHGVNQIVFHGYSSAERVGETGWPGWSPFTSQGGNGFSEAWGPRQPTWADTDKITDWTARVQHVLRQGRPSVDLVVYRHSYGHDVRVPEGAAGYTYDYAGPDQLAGTTVAGGRLAPDGPGYRALVLDRPPTLPVATARLLLAHARSGLPIVVVGALPDRVPGAHRAGRQDAELARLLQVLVRQPSVRRVYGQDGLAAVLKELGVTPAADAAGLAAVRRTVPSGELYHLHNPTDRTVTADVSLAGTGRPYELDAWTGTIAPLGRYRAGSGRVSVPLSLSPGASTIIALAGRHAPHAVATTGGEVVVGDSGALRLRATAAGTYTVTLDDGTRRRVVVPVVAAAAQPGGWTLSVDDWHRGTDGRLAITRHDLELGALRPWSELPGLADVSGVGTYRTTFHLTGADGAWLDLGRVTDTVEVTVNGTVLPAPDQVTRHLDLADQVREGTNTLTVRVATPLRNRLRVTEGFPAQTAKTRQEYGLLGPVRITPYREVPIAG
ncbi:glycosyl hydrolase [Streptomyces sp. NPDC051940]|uniref:glycosyl hydrolase n=1 Tax=Streptomyces sp. NPDC051940 TaxID=3155675 RepID=UPI00343D80CA